MGERTCAGYRLEQRLPAASASVEHWRGRGPGGTADVYIGPRSLAERARALPSGGPFAEVEVGATGTRWYVAVPGAIEADLPALRARLGPGPGLALGWHLARALAELHEAGGAHGALHPEHVGIGDDGRLVVRPALAAPIPADPDPAAPAQATDCLQFAALLEALGLEDVDDLGAGLLLAGLRRERARVRMQPGRAARQAIAALLHRHPEWESALVDALGPAYALDPSAPLRVRPGAMPGPAGRRPAARVRVTDAPAPPAGLHVQVRPAAAPVAVARGPRVRPPEPPEDATTLVAAGAPLAEEDTSDENTDVDGPTPLPPRPRAVARLGEPATRPRPAAVRVPLAAAPPAAEEGQGRGPGPAAAGAAGAAGPDGAEPDDAGVAEAPGEAEPDDAEALGAPRGTGAEPGADDAQPPAEPGPAAPSGADAPEAPAEAAEAPPAEPAPPAREPPVGVAGALFDDAPAGADAPRWAGIAGITGNPDREAELDEGKWAESARPLEEVVAELPSGPTRALELGRDEGGAPRVALLVAAGLAALLLLAVLLRPGGPTLFVTSEPPGATITLDGRDIGVAPVDLRLPDDDEAHELCAVLGERRACRHHTAEQLRKLRPELAIRLPAP